MLGRPVGEVVAPGIELTSVARGVRIGGEYALQHGGQFVDALSQFDLPGSGGGLQFANQIGAVGDLRRLRPTDIGRLVYEPQIRDLYSGVPGGPREFQVTIDGKLVNGEADFVAQIDGRFVAIEAKYTDDWLFSPRNPDSPKGQLPFLKHMQPDMLDQARIYEKAFPGGTIYHSNSVELIDYYRRAFAEAGVNNVTFIHTPLRGDR